MDFLFSIGIRKMPKIPDKYNSCLLTSFELTDILSKKGLLKLYLNKKKHGNSDIKYNKKLV